jgi:hypothetical protein
MLFVRFLLRAGLLRGKHGGRGQQPAYQSFQIRHSLNSSLQNCYQSRSDLETSIAKLRGTPVGLGQSWG